MTTSTQTPAIATDANGRTHIVWNQNGMIYHAYYNPAGGQWVESAPIANSTSSREIKISTDVATGTEGNTSNSGIFVSWLEGEGNTTEIKGIQGTQNTLGQFLWGQKQTISSDVVHDENIDMVTTADGNILLISEKVDFNDPQADKDLYTHIVELKNNPLISSNLVHFNPVTTDSFSPKNPLVLSQINTEAVDSELLPSTFLFTVTNEIGWERPLSFIKEVQIKNVLSYGGGTGLTDEEESKNFLAYLMARDELSVSLVLGEYAEVIAEGSAEGKINLEIGPNEGSSKLSASDAFEFLFETELNLLPLLGIPPLEVGNTGIELQAGIILGVSFTLEQEWELADFDFPDLEYWYSLVRADGSPAQLGDDPSQLYWRINKDEAVDNFFAPPSSEEATLAGSFTEGTNTGIIGLTAGIFGKAKLEAGGLSLLDLGADLSITANFEVFPDQKFTSLEELLTLEVGLFGFGTEIEIEGEQNFGAEELLNGMEADFISGSSAIYANNPIDNNISENLTNDTAPKLVTADNGDIYAVWINDTHNINDLSHILISKSVDGGNTWSPSSEIPNSQGMNFDPVIGITGSGQILVAWTNGSSDIFYDDQQDQDNDGKLDVDPDKLDEALTQSTLYYSISNDGGVTWTEGNPILPNIQTPQKMSLSQMSDGKLLLTWFVADEDNDAIPEDKLYSAFWNGSTWSQSLLVATGDIHLLETPVAESIGGSPTIFWTQTSSTDPNDAPDKVNIYYSIYNQQFNQWLSSPILFSPEVSNLARLQEDPEVLVLGNNSNTSTQMLGQFSHNRIVAEGDVTLVIPHVLGNGKSELKVFPMSVRENESEAVLLVHRTGDIGEEVSFNYRTVDGSASSGADYEGRSGTLTFASGEVVKRISIPLLDDGIAERRSENFRVVITSNHPNAHHLINGSLIEGRTVELVATVGIIDDEPTNLAEIDSGFILEADPQAQAGMAVIPAGNLNQDGVNDFLIGAPGKNDGDGMVYVVYGDPTIGIRDQRLSLDSLDGNNGVIIEGVENSRLGSSLASADFDGDGINDLILGAPQNPVESLAGKVYIIQGSTLHGKSNINLASAGGLVLTSSESASGAGSKVVVGDVTGDGVADVIVSAPSLNKIYVVSGSAIKNALTNKTASINLDSLGNNGFVLNTGTGRIGTGLGIADVNGNGVYDLLLGAPQANPVDYTGSPNLDYEPSAYGGQVYVVFGGNGLNGSLDLSQLNGTNGLILKGQAFYNVPDPDSNYSTGIDPTLQPDLTIADSAGTNVVNAGDINNDGYDDFIISAADSATGGIQARGRAYVVFGKASGWNNSIDLSNLNGTNGFIINGIYDLNQNTGGNAGYSISALGDVNDDSYDDFLISAPTLSTNGDNSATGQSYLILGADTPQWSNFLNNGVLELSDINVLSQRVFLFNNPIAGKQLGLGLGSVGDVDGDGSPDLAMATPQVYPGQESSEIYIAYGHPWIGAGGSIDVNKLRSDNGFVFQPITKNEVGTVQLGGDINRDGYVDTLIADAGFEGAGGKIVYLFFGSDPLQPTTFTPSVPITLSDNDGVIIGTQSLDYGDFNNDGIPDLVIAQSGSSEQTYATVVFGSEDNSFWSSLDPTTGISLNDLLRENGGIKINATGWANQGSPVNVASGDFNGDGVDDVVVNSANLNPLIVFGQETWQTKTVTSLSVQSQSLAIQPEYNIPITYVNDVGDVNGDGYTDLGLTSVNPNGGSVGYIVFGNSSLSSNSSLNLANLNGSNGFKIPLGAGEFAPISQAGDINGDGYDDFIIGTGDGTFGGAYIFFGSNSLGSDGTLNYNNLNGSNGFSIAYSPQALGYSVTGGGDINGDGYDDLVVGSPSGSGSKGNIYTIFGSSSVGGTGQIDVDQLTGTNGFHTIGAQTYSLAGSFVGGLSDVNGDGFADLGIGAQGDNSNSVSGLAYNVFGNDYLEQVNYNGTFDNDIFSATQLATSSVPHIMNGAQGDDILQSAGVNINAGGKVVMNGGQGDDLLSIGSLNFDRIDGGTGIDTLQLNSFILSSNNLDLTNSRVSSRIKGIEIIDLGSNNRVTLNLQSLTSLSDTTNTFKVLGHKSYVVASDYQNWIKQNTVTEDGVTFDQYSNKSTRLLIEQSDNIFQSTAINSQSVYGTDSDDLFVFGTPAHFTGEKNIVFAQSGNDLIDLSDGAGENIVYGGAGEDNLIGGKNDLLFGGIGNDLLDTSSNQSNNKSYGEEGDDTFYLGQKDHGFGGEGNDIFFMHGSGENLVTGGQGQDQFWIADVEIAPSFNAIMDFEIGEDTIGLKGFASRQDEIELIQYGHDVLITLGNQYLARVMNVFEPFLQINVSEDDLLIQATTSTPIQVVNTNDSGAGSLRQAIIDAGNNPGADTIDMGSITNKTINLVTPLPTIEVGNDIIFKTAGVFGTPTIKAPNIAFANIFTIQGANVSLSYLNLTGGFAQGGNGFNGGGGGLGAGGALTVLDNSTVTVDNVIFSNNQARGGNGSTGNSGGGGEFAGTPDDKPETGGGGGSFNANTQASNGGAAGSIGNGEDGGNGRSGGSGGFGIGGGGGGGGGGGSGGDWGNDCRDGGDGGYGGSGGFGAGGGSGGGGGGAGPQCDNHAGDGGSSGNGGSFGGKGSDGKDGHDPKIFSGSGPGDGGTGGGGAGLGGAVFINAANVTITNSTFQNNRTTAGVGANPGQALGGGVFINTNATVMGNNLTFSNNTAPNSEGGTFTNVYGVSQNNNDVYGTISSYSTVESELFSVPSLSPDSLLKTPIYRFRTGNATYIYVGEEERQSILAGGYNFVEEGEAFKVAMEFNELLDPIYRFRNNDLAGAYLYVGEEERQSINENYTNFIEEGLAFYVYGADTQMANDIYRFQTQPGGYIFVGEAERQNILEGGFNFTEEGTAFEALLG